MHLVIDVIQDLVQTPYIEKCHRKALLVGCKGKLKLNGNVCSRGTRFHAFLREAHQFLKLALLQARLLHSLPSGAVILGGQSFPFPVSPGIAITWLRSKPLRTDQSARKAL